MRTMNTRHRSVGDPVRNSGGRWTRHLIWLAALVAALSLMACEQEQVLDLPVTAVPTKAQGTIAPTPTQVVKATPSPSGGGVQPPTGTSSSNTGGPAGGALTISVVGDSLQYDKQSLTVNAGSDVTLMFTNVAAVQQHNWVLVKPGTKDEVAMAGTLAGVANGWIPVDDDRVFANSSLLDAGASEEIKFTAPAAGTYPFVCTFPGHNATMVGDFIVK